MATAQVWQRRMVDQLSMPRRYEQAPRLSPNDVHLQIKAVSLNLADKNRIKRGKNGPVIKRDTIPCTDAIGVVSSIGSAVTRFKVGDRACTTVMPGWIDGALTHKTINAAFDHHGVLASHIQRDEGDLVLVPDYLTDIEASTLPLAALTAWHAVMEIRRPEKDDTVIVQMASDVAPFAAQFAMAVGARVISVCYDVEGFALTKRLGINLTVDAHMRHDWWRDVLKLTHLSGAELGIDMGTNQGLQNTINAVSPNGTVAIISQFKKKHLVDIRPITNANLRMQGVESGPRKMFERMIDFMTVHEIRPVIKETHPLSMLQKALESLYTNPLGKIVLTMPSPHRF